MIKYHPVHLSGRNVTLQVKNPIYFELLLRYLSRSLVPVPLNLMLFHRTKYVTAGPADRPVIVLSQPMHMFTYRRNTTFNASESGHQINKNQFRN